MIAASTKKWDGAADAAAADRLSIWLLTTSLLFVFVQLAKYLCYKGPDDLLECLTQSEGTQKQSAQTIAV